MPSRPGDRKFKGAGPGEWLPRREALLHKLPRRAEHARRDLGSGPVFRIEIADGAAGDAARRCHGVGDIQPLLAQAPRKIGCTLPGCRILGGISDGDPGRRAEGQPEVGRGRRGLCRRRRCRCGVLGMGAGVRRHDANRNQDRKQAPRMCRTAMPNVAPTLVEGGLCRPLQTLPWRHVGDLSCCCTSDVGLQADCASLTTAAPLSAVATLARGKRPVQEACRKHVQDERATRPPRFTTIRPMSACSPSCWRIGPAPAGGGARP